jgi:hypothetical protein
MLRVIVFEVSMEVSELVEAVSLFEVHKNCKSTKICIRISHKNRSIISPDKLFTLYFLTTFRVIYETAWFRR